MASISLIYSDTVASFRRLLFTLGAEDCRPVAMGQVGMAQVLDELGRLQIWGDQSRANLPEKARGSLDDVLRNNDTLRRVTQSILNQLQDAINISIPIAERKYDPLAGSDQDSVSSVSADSDSESDADDAPEDRRRVSKIEFLVSQIQEQIQSLYRLSVTLRRPGAIGRYLRSTGKNAHGSLQSSFQEYDYNHICEKLLQWNNATKVVIATQTEDEPVSKGFFLSEFLESHTPILQILARRLADANTKRREQLEYWNTHPDTSNQANVRNEGAEQPRIEHDTSSRVDKNIESQSQVSTIIPGKTLTQGSFKSSQAFSSVAKSAMDDKTEFGRSRTEYAESVFGSKQSNRVPDIPRIAESEQEFECPYCHQIMESQSMLNRQQWKRHVFRDLRPYLCTFETCQSPEKLYATRHEWEYHEMQMHRRRWLCEDCDTASANRGHMVNHIRECHQDMVTEAQLQIMVDMTERRMDDSEISSCPLCPEKPMSLRQLTTHISQHMEELSLFVLSRPCEDDGSLASQKAARSASGGIESPSDDTGRSSHGPPDTDIRQENFIRKPEGSTEGVVEGDVEEGVSVNLSNIPLTMTKSEFRQVLVVLGPPRPITFDYHLENGVFEGRAFMTFRNSKEANHVVKSLRGVTVRGQKLTVERSGDTRQDTHQQSAQDFQTLLHRDEQDGVDKAGQWISSEAVRMRRSPSRSYQAGIELRRRPDDLDQIFIEREERHRAEMEEARDRSASPLPSPQAYRDVYQQIEWVNGELCHHGEQTTHLRSRSNLDLSSTRVDERTVGGMSAPPRRIVVDEYGDPWYETVTSQPSPTQVEPGGPIGPLPANPARNRPIITWVRKLIPGRELSESQRKREKPFFGEH